MNLYDVIKRPLVTEKAENARQTKNVYMFEVDKRANKTLVKQAVKAIYNVVPEKINVLYKPGKVKRGRFGFGFKSGIKKAYVTLKKDDKIELFEGV